MHPIAVSIVAFSFFVLSILLLGVAIRVRRVEGQLIRILERMRRDEVRDGSDVDGDDEDHCDNDEDEDDKLERAGITVKRWNDSMR